MAGLALLVRLEARPGREDEVAGFLEDALALVRREPGIVSWYAVRLGPSTFAIFDTFADEGGRQAHLGGEVAAALLERAPELLAGDPVIEPADVLAATSAGG